MEPDMARSDRDYQRQRLRDELNRARSAESICARRAHLELARLYRERVRAEQRVRVLVIA
jgi:hypothetical protein